MLLRRNCSSSHFLVLWVESVVEGSESLLLSGVFNILASLRFVSFLRSSPLTPRRDMHCSGAKAL
jgi:hypothetical protein